MSRNAQLEARITGDLPIVSPYHSPMEGNYRGTHTAPVPPPPWPPYYPPAKPARRWLPIAIIVAAIVIAAALVSTAIIMSNDSDNGGSPVANGPSNSDVAPRGNGSEALASSTCEAWPSTKDALMAIPQLPPGWDWNTPNIDTYIGNRTAAITTAIDLFEREIAPTPADVAETARSYVSERRKEVRMLREHTYTTAEGVAGNIASSKLDQLCSAK